ncbi:putative NRPS-like enzyme [Xylariaceae sp. FL0255]|nr:putative NRPS-like enzyme [Xylariaceae sp. FL0255]
MTAEHAEVSNWEHALFPNIVDRLSRERPRSPYALWPTEDGSDFITTTYADLANIVNGLAWWIDRNLGQGAANAVLTYIGPNDVRLIALLLACVKTGYGLFLTSPRNSPEAQRSLFKKLNCETLVTTDPTPQPALAVIEAVKPRHLAIPNIAELRAKHHPLYIYNKTFEEGRQDILAIMHTSGSTGIPKPLIWSQETGLRQCNNTNAKTIEGTKSVDHFLHGKRVLSTLPPFHGAGLCQYLFNAIPYGNTIITPSSAAIATGQGVVDALKKTPADVAILVPSVVAEIANDPQLLEYCANHLEMILYIGGDLPQAIGDRVASKLPLHCQWGASEVGIPQQLLPTELGCKDWHYIRFHPCLGAVFEAVTDRVYELVIKRDDAKRSNTQLSFTIRGMENLHEYRTRDLFERHPTIANAWRWRARADDIIVFLNGEKTNPVSMEQHIEASNPVHLGGAIVVGAQRFQAALLVDPRGGGETLSMAEKAALIERVWPSVQEANHVVPAHARVEKSMIAVVDKPLIRAGKGTVQRAASLLQYVDDIERVYASAEINDGDEDGSDGIDMLDRDAVLRFVRSKVYAIVEGIANDLTNFFDSGMDSLGALRLMRALHGLDRVGSKMSLSTIYQNPTVRQLAAALMQKEYQAGGDKEVFQSLLATYTGTIEQLPKSVEKEKIFDTKMIDVILTGSTGSMGTYILHSLLQRPGIAHITCLNRSADGGVSAQEKAFASHNFDTTPLKTGSRITFLCANLAHPKLGLDSKVYEALLTPTSPTVIIHNAWPVNFNLSLSAFRPHLAGLVNLFSLAAQSKKATRLSFVSSVSAVGGYTIGPAPERVLHAKDAGMPFANGYAQSKFIAEVLCAAAAAHLHVPVAIARVGQVAGALRSPGIWNPAEWLPSLVLGSLRIGCIPKDLGLRWENVDWVPVDALAESIVDLVQRPNGGSDTETEVFNLRNPQVVAWGKALLPAIIDELCEQKNGLKLEPVSSEVWLDRLQGGLENDGEDLGGNPALKLLEFYKEALRPGDSNPEGVQPMAIDHALACSKALRKLEGINQASVQKWVREWLIVKEQ